MKIIKDPVHGYVEVEDWALPLLDSPMLQRLRYVKQLGFSYLVYPGANHTRFEHSLGTMHLAGLMCRQIGLAEPERRLILARCTYPRHRSRSPLACDRTPYERVPRDIPTTR